MMNHEHDDVIMFPVWRQQLEDQSLDAVKRKNYEEALLHIDKLESFHEATNEILTAKVICLIELSRYDEAIRLCRKLMRVDEEHYFKYLHIYLSILFQTSQYSEVIDLLDEINETETVPEEYEHSYKQIYEMSKQFIETSPEQQSEEHIEHFIDSLENGNFQEQWKLLSMHRTHSIYPYLKKITPYLADTNLNPVIKTGILQWCMDEEVDEKLEIEKFGKNELFIPKDLVDVLQTDFAKNVLNKLEHIEQSDPTLYLFIKQILYRFLYVHFPYTPIENEAQNIAEAVTYLGNKYLQINEKKLDQYISDRILSWVEEIEILEQKYFSQIEV